MGIWEAIWKCLILGTVQGLTEFLPVSSSGHLELFRTLLKADFGSEAAETFFDVMMHIGTLVAVVALFRKDIAALFHRPLKPLCMLVVATIPAGVFGILAKVFDWDAKLMAGGYLAVFFAATALLLLVTELVAKRQKTTRPLGWRNTVPMGLIQAIAVLPGISRSGSTIAMGVMTGGKREEVARFSFLMSIPVILGALLVSAADVAVHHSELTASGNTAALAIGVCVGCAAAAVSGLFAIKVMLKAIGAANYKWFAVYLAILSLVYMWLQIIGVV